MQTEFAVVPFAPPVQPAALSVQQLAEIMPKLDLVEDWIGAVRTYAQQLLEQGQEVPGYKLVEKRANRTWIDEAAATKMLAEHGDAIYAPRELKSPAQMEKTLGKRVFSTYEPTLVVKRSSGVTMAPAHDPRPAVAGIRAEEAFDAIAATPTIDDIL